MHVLRRRVLFPVRQKIFKLLRSTKLTSGRQGSYMVREKSWIVILTCSLVIGSVLINVGKAEPTTGKTEQVCINDLVVWIEYSYDITNISLITLNFTISPYYWIGHYMSNLYIEYATFKIMDISAPLNEVGSYDFNLTSERALYSPNNVTTELSGVVPIVQEFPPHYIRVYGFFKFRHLESSDWTVAVIPFTLSFSQYDYFSWGQLKADNNSLKASSSGSQNLMYAFAVATAVLLTTTAFFGLEWRRQRRILKSIK